jgi:D-glycero-D-manno-heptose 1,7-bisphosphate phosphatase
MNKAVFLDRDGVINVDRGYTYRIEDFEFIDGVFEACKLFAASGYRLIVVTNQSGIGRGLYSEQDFLTLTEWMKGQFRSQGIALDAVYFCPHHPEQGQGRYKQFCECRKPQPGMLLQGIAEFGLEPDRCVMFGDKVSDLEAARAAGIGRKVFVNDQSASAAAKPPLADEVWQSIAEAKRRF